ncbi:cadmium-translocating P-type ATPase [Mycobacterium sp. SM1]|uniref:heavy metal translocating P-type ATPase n=1 Tax=Mycobacterium sp. SM1 TaxID=2816243 RepID=UPI001BD12D13|nr:heavy metal translocating P-type ATPase [Mycobacterium sp. SM1]MBS4729496.1 cadmium-translocating P-type ATPase [Mycobacterium sp. SM1]
MTGIALGGRVRNGTRRVSGRPLLPRPTGSVWWALGALALFVPGLGAQFAGAPPIVWWALYLGCYVSGGWQPARSGLRALRHKTFDVDLLMVLAAIAAAAVGQVDDGALLIVIFATSGALEDIATKRTAHSVRGLLDLAPDRAVVIDGGGHQRGVAAAELVVGDRVLVRPGERISADGIVVSGSSEVDQSSITGESLPVIKAPGDEVFAGTLNGSGALQVLVTRDPTQTVVARIVALVTHASATKAKTQLFIERLERRYSVGVVVATLALVTGALLCGARLDSALLRAITFMIVASPCAVVLATMPPLLSAIANAGRHGVLVKSAVVVERLAGISIVALDKTGTLTCGVPRLTTVESLDPDRIDGKRLLQLAAAAEQSSEHPLGRAIVDAARSRGVAIPPAAQFRALPGRGVRAVVGPALVELCSPHSYRGPLIPQLARIQEEGATAVVVLVDGSPAGVLGLSDQIRPEAAGAVAALRALTARSPVLLTGDNSRAATHAARHAGISEVRAALLPEQKVDAVRELQSGGHRVLVVGDGVNDAPAMAAAYAAIAMGAAGSDLALQTADGVTVRDELHTIPTIIALARRARRVVIANLAIAAAVIAALVAWDLLGYLPLPLGVAGHEGSTVLVALNGLRLLTNGAWRAAAAPHRGPAGSTARRTPRPPATTGGRTQPAGSAIGGQRGEQARQLAALG